MICTICCFFMLLNLLNLTFAQNPHVPAMLKLLSLKTAMNRRVDTFSFRCQSEQAGGDKVAGCVWHCRYDRYLGRAVLHCGSQTSALPPKVPWNTVWWTHIGTKRSVLWSSNTSKGVSSWGEPRILLGCYWCFPDPLVAWQGDTSSIRHPSQRICAFVLPPSISWGALTLKYFRLEVSLYLCLCMIQQMWDVDHTQGWILAWVWFNRCDMQL